MSYNHNYRNIVHQLPVMCIVFPFIDAAGDQKYFEGHYEFIQIFDLLSLLKFRMKKCILANFLKDYSSIRYIKPYYFQTRQKLEITVYGIKLSQLIAYCCSQVLDYAQTRANFLINKRITTLSIFFEYLIDYCQPIRMTIFESINHHVRSPGMTLKVSWCILNKHSSSEHILRYTTIEGKANLDHSGSQIHEILSKDRGSLALVHYI